VSSEKVRVNIGDQTLSLSNLSKVLYPEYGFTKGEVIDYYVSVAEPLLAHLADRPLTRKRWPDGVDAQPFFEKNAPRGTPDWARVVHIAEHGDAGVDYIVADDLPTLVWLANLAALELHVPQWKVDGDGKIQPADLLVFDLDPGPPATIVDCAQVALLLRDSLADDGLDCWAKTSGAKGAQMYVPLDPTGAEETSEYAKALAERLSTEHPDLVVARMTKQVRAGKVFIDWSQNNAAKTTIAPYSLRGTPEPAVSTPLTWEELEAAENVADLRFGPADLADRLCELGDLLEPMRSTQQALPTAR
jgi:bifunctional non-homologous end joining protein LigD